MNNEVLQNVPNAPANVASWPLFTAVHGINIDFGNTDEVINVHRTARRMLLAQLKLMALTRCQACGGHSHTKRHCLTNHRLTML